ncbi:flagellar hook-associated protein FlgL [Sulfuriflexus mobilis]|uniref:flagellar hook-associated protein FlgL n=1 Tax=Sulfuriflexus mobilis TaxID=1811807 RepID=UPI000F81BEF9|nr:flagellar hook-associated protein FlgL [Sulfuriflexus mobilis]
MRISTSQLNATAINSILDQQVALSRTQLQIAAGRRILAPSDDPAGAARALNLSESISATTQYEKNADTATARLRLEEISLTSVTELIQRVRVLTLQGNNDVLDNESRPQIAAEIRQRLDELVSLANTRDANNEYIFSGFQSLTKAFTVNPDGSVSYNGDEGQRFLQIGPSRQIATGDSGAEIFGLLGSGNGEFSSRAHAFNTGSGVIGTNTIVDPATYIADDYTVVLGEQTAVTGGAIGLTDTNANDTLQYELQINGTLIDTLGEGDSRTLAQIETAINVETPTTGVRAYIDAGQLYLANTLPTATPITVSETLTGATDGAADTVTGFFGSALTGAAPTNDVIFDAANGYLVLDSSNAIVTSAAYVDGGSINFNGQQLTISGTPSNGDQFLSTPNSQQDLFGTLQSLIGALESPSTNTSAVPTTASLASITEPVAAGGGETFQVTIDGIDLINVALPGAGTVTAAQLDTAVASFINANAGYRIASGSFAGADLVLQKDDGSDLVIAIPQNTTATPAVLAGLVGSATNGTPADLTISSGFHAIIDRVLGNLDSNLGNIIDTRASIGARLNSIDDQNNLNEASIIQVQTTLSEIQDLDYAEAISQLEQQRLSLQAAQQSFIRIQSLSLFNFL